MTWTNFGAGGRALILAGMLAAALGPGPAPVGAQTAAGSASFLPASGVLTVIGTSADNTLVVSRNAAGKLFVNDGTIAIVGGPATVANTSLIQVFGLAGGDTLALSEANGALPRANLFGGGGDDALTGGSGADQLFGQAGNDALQGRGGGDLLFGGDGDDTLTGGDADDQAFGEAGDDRMIWNPGDDTDLNEGGDGLDGVEVNGFAGAETFDVAAVGLRTRLDRITPSPFRLDIGTVERLTIAADAGNDVLSVGSNLVTLTEITLDGGAGNDALLGGNGREVLLGGDGADFIDGNAGDDVARMGAGDDLFNWDAGDGSDTVEGQLGADTLRLAGANVGEAFALAADGARARLTRGAAGGALDLDDVERVELNARDGADVITVDPLTGTDVTSVVLDLASSPGAAAGDGQADTIVLNGGELADAVTLLGEDDGFKVTGLPATVRVLRSEGAHDRLAVNTRGGNDTVTALVSALTVALTVDGGVGDDAITGGAGDEMLSGGDGSDTIDGGAGDDRLDGGAGDDVLSGGGGDDRLDGGDGRDTLAGGVGDDAVDGGAGDDLIGLGAGDDLASRGLDDGSDVVEGQGGLDTVRLSGTAAGERLELAASGGRVRLTREAAAPLVDLSAIARIEVDARAGADTIVVGDLSGVGVVAVALSLGSGPGGRAGAGVGDGEADAVVVAATAGADALTIAREADAVTVAGLPFGLAIRAAEGARDRLRVEAGPGGDLVTAALPAGAIGLTVDGGGGDDALTGGAGDDVLLGGAGDDHLRGGDGDDRLVGGPGADLLDGGDGRDVGVEGETMIGIP